MSRGDFTMPRRRFGLYLLGQAKAFSYLPFQQEAVCLFLEQFAAGVFEKGMIHAPPRMGKSEIATVHFPAWYLGHFPHHSVMVVCSSGALATGFGRKTRNLLESPFHAATFPDCKIAWDSRAKDDFTLTKGGRYYAMGLDGQMTGRGAHLLIVDDPIKSTQDALSEAAETFRREVFTSAINTRLEPDGRLLVVMTKWPGEGFSGWLLEKFGAQEVQKTELAQWRATPPTIGLAA